MSFRRTLLTAAFCLSASCAATAGAPVYVAVSVGPNFLHNNTAKTSNNDNVNKGNHLGYNGGIAVGLKSGNWRHELEASYYRNTPEGLKINSAKVENVNGNTDARFFGYNIYYDFPQLIDLVSPYAGVGAGYLRAQENIKFATAAHLKGHGNFLAGQAILGAKFELANRLSLLSEVRYLSTTSAQYNFKNSSGVVGKFRDNYQHYSMRIGLLYSFF